MPDMEKKFCHKILPTILILILWIPVLIRGEIVVKASTDANRLAPNETFTYRIETSGSDEFPEVDISPALNNFNLISGPGQQTNFQWINGKMSGTRTLTWTFNPKKTGKLEFPSLSARIGHRIFKTQPIIIQVADARSNTISTGGADDLYLVVEPDKKRAYPGEQMTITYKLYTKVSLRGIEYIEQPKTIGFWVDDLYSPSQPQFRDVTIGSVRYKVATLYKAALFPTKSGQLKISPMVVKCQVEVKSNRQSRRSLFDDFFADPFAARTITKVIQTDTVVIDIKSFPKPQPKNFSGAVGNFQLEAKIDRRKVKTHEAVAFKLILKGTGNLNLFEFPDPEFPTDLEVFPPTSEYKKDPFRDDISGTITREYILIPRAAGQYDLPQIVFPFFNPKANKWHSIKTRPITISVESNRDALIENTNLTKEEVALLSKDIRYIKTGIPRWYSTGRGSISFMIVLFYLLAIGLVLTPGAIKNFHNYNESTFGIRRSGRALKIALGKLDQIDDNVHAQITGIVYHYLQDKLNLKSSNLAPDAASNILDGRISANLLDCLHTLLVSCDAARYAPGSIKHDDDILIEARSIIKSLDSEL